MSFNLRLFHSGVGSMRNMFDKKADDHRKTQESNPFSDWEGAGLSQRRLSKDDEYYGRPLPGSESERRAQAAQHHIMMDIKYLCEMIWDCAEWKSPDGRAAISFGKLFNLYNAISDKVVGTLLRARKHGFVFFEGEMLYQRRDDFKVIELSRNINTIKKRFGSPLILTAGGEPEEWDAMPNGIGTNKESTGEFQRGGKGRKHSVPQISATLSENTPSKHQIRRHSDTSRTYTDAIKLWSGNQTSSKLTSLVEEGTLTDEKPLSDPDIVNNNSEVDSPEEISDKTSTNVPNYELESGSTENSKSLDLYTKNKSVEILPTVDCHDLAET